MAFSYNDIKSALDQAKAATGGKFVAFDAAYYVQRYSIVKDENGAILDNSLASFTGDPLKHYVETGAAKGYAPNAWFDATFYRAQYADVRDGYTNADLIAHYALFGAYEGRAPSSLLATFDGERYLRDNPEVADYVNGNLGQFGGSATNGAIAHFVLFGAQEGRHGYTTAGADTGFTFVPKTATIAPVTDGNTTEMSLNTNGGATTLVGNNAVADGDAATAGTDTLRLVGDAAVRIDMTNPANQLRGIDLNGNGILEANGIENNVSGVNKVTVKNFEIVDAYARNPLNEGDRAHNFTGDIAYDGTGFDGDGVSTNGNIVLGGMGADTIKGGIGNDFIAGGGVTTGRTVADSLSGGRNADFFFAELSELDNTDGNTTDIDGGLTSDDSAAGNVQTAQDSDWLLLEASDDDEPVQITLRNENADSLDTTTGSIITRAGQHVATLKDIENVNASGNLYGFLNGVDVEMGGRRLDNRDVAGAENYGLGSSAQLNIDGSKADNIIIGGYDNDNIAGNDGNDLLFGGDLRYIKTNSNNPNLTGITNDGVDNLAGGAGNDNLVVEFDRGSINGSGANEIVPITTTTVIMHTPADDFGVGQVLVSKTTTVTNTTTGALISSSSEIVGLFPSAAVPDSAAAGTTVTTGTVSGDSGYDSLYLTDYSIGRKAATEAASNDDALKDGKIRLDLGYADYDGYRGYNDDLTAGDGKSMRIPGRADTADQTNYEAGEKTAAGANVYTTITNNEAIVATGLGNIDYKAAGSNDPELNFANQQNYNGINANLDLRGTDSSSTFASSYTQGVSTKETASSILNIDLVSNILYANTGNDVVEGREGNDLLSGGAGLDDFVFATGGSSVHDGVDVIWKQKDANGDGIWDKGAATPFDKGAWTAKEGYVGDFGDKSTDPGHTFFNLELVDKTNDNQELSNYVTKLSNITVKLDGQTYKFNLNLSDVDPVNLTYANAVSLINKQIAEDPQFAALKGSVTARISANDMNVIVLEDARHRAFGDKSTAAVDYAVKAPSHTDWDVLPDSNPDTISGDRIIYKAYEDRHDNEGVDDDAVLGSTISLGRDAYAQDRVVSFDATNGTRIAEEQRYTVYLKNVTTEDVVTISVNGVQYQLQVGVAEDGTLLNSEDAGQVSQTTVQSNFTTRLVSFINSFMDDDSAAGRVTAVAGTPGVVLPDLSLEPTTAIVLTQHNYHDGLNGDVDGEAVVFMNAPTVSIQNKSGGEPGSYAVVNKSDSEVLLYQFDGRDGLLNANNVLFVGEEFERNGSTADNSRSVLATAKNTGATLNGSDAIVIDAGTDDVAGVARNLAVASLLQAGTGRGLTDNFAVHGDDLLIGGTGNDTINGLSGDDRIIGSAGKDSVDGGKDLYLVTRIGEKEGTVVSLNAYEASIYKTQAGNSNVLDVKLIEQTEDGLALKARTSTAYTDYFQDTLVFQQADFVTDPAAPTPGFTITLDKFTQTSTGSIIQPDGGAGHVAVDGTQSQTTFTNIEHIRTVSGTGLAVAGANGGQGHDTLDVSALSDATSGVTYVLSGGDTDIVDAFTGVGGPAADDGKVIINTGENYRLKAGVIAGTATPIKVGGYNDLYDDTTTTPVEDQVRDDSVFIVVDGVENVKAGKGNDTLFIDETEAAKNNAFTGDTGSDAIIYRNEYVASVSAPNPFVSEPTVTITIKAGGTPDTVSMTGGRVGTVTATDTLDSVEFINLEGNTARGKLMDTTDSADKVDTIDVTNLSSGAIVDYTTGKIWSMTPTALEMTVFGLNQIEHVKADGADTVIVSDGMTAENDHVTFNSRDDVDDVKAAQSLAIDTYLNYDFVDARAVAPVRLDLAHTRAIVDDADNTEGWNKIGTDKTLDSGDLPKAVNFHQYTFEMGPMSDTIDYSNETGDIVAVVNFDPADDSKGNPQNVLVDHNGDGDFKDAHDRVDELLSVENIVAAQGQSTIDLTQSTTDLQVEFSYGYKQNDDNAATDTSKRVTRVSNGTGVDQGSVNLIDYRDLTPTKNTESDDRVDAYWSDIEGSDHNETVVFTAAEYHLDNWLNLRGGANIVNYKTDSGTKVDMTIDMIDSWIGAGAARTGLSLTQIAAAPAVDNRFYLTAVGTDADGQSGTDIITAYTGKNALSPNSTVLVAGTTDKHDSFSFDSHLDGFAKSVNSFIENNARYFTVNIAGQSNTLRLTGFESLKDSASNDTYDIKKLVSLLTDGDLTLTDNVGDVDTIVVYDDTVGAFGSSAHQISLENINTAMTFDFDVLDVTQVTSSGLTITGDTNGAHDLNDQVILGSLGLVSDVQVFNRLAITNASVTSSGSTFDLDATAGELQNAAGNKIFTITNTAYELDASRVTSGGVTLSLTGPAINGRLVGGTGNDTITGDSGNDVILGGAGNDTLNGGGALKYDTWTVQLNNIPATGDGSVTILGATVALTAGQGSDAVGTAFAALGKNAFTDGSGHVPTSVTYSADSDTLTFKFAVDVAPAELNAGDVSYTDSTFTVSAPTQTQQFALAGAGNDVIRGGTGTDVIDSGAGNDSIIVVGSVDQAHATAYATLFANQAAVDAAVGASNVVMRSELTTVNTSSDISGAEVINAGAGSDTLHVFGIADLTGTTIDFTNLESIVGHSTVTLSATQIAAMAAAGTQLTFAGQVNTLIITGLTNSTDINLSTLGLANVDNVVLSGLTSYSGHIISGLGASIFKLGDGTSTASGATVNLTGAGIMGTAGNDNPLNGNASIADLIVALAGDDTIDGRGGSATEGDTISGGLGNDTITGYLADKLVDGGDGVDTLTFALTAVDTETLENTTDSAGVFRNIENVTVTGAFTNAQDYTHFSGFGAVVTLVDSDNVVSIDKTDAHDLYVDARVAFDGNAAVTITGAFDSTDEYSTFSNAAIGGVSRVLDDSDNLVTIDLTDAAALIPLLGTVFNTDVVSGDALTITGAFTDALDYSTYSAGGTGGVSRTLDDNNNAVTIDTTDLAALIANTNTVFAANDNLTVTGAFDAALGYATFSDSNVGGSTRTLDDSGDNAVTINTVDLAALIADAKLKFAADDVVTVTGAYVGTGDGTSLYTAMTAAAVGGLKVVLDDSDNTVSMTAAEAQTFNNVGNLSFAANDVITVTDTDTAITLSAAGLAGQSVIVNYTNTTIALVDLLNITVTGFDAATDKFYEGTAATSFQGIGAGAGAALTILANGVVEITGSAIAALSVGDTADSGVVETALAAAIGDADTALADGDDILAVLYGTDGNAYVYQVDVTTATANMATGDIVVELIGQLNSIAADSLAAINFI